MVVMQDTMNLQKNLRSHSSSGAIRYSTSSGVGGYTVQIVIISGTNRDGGDIASMRIRAFHYLEPIWPGSKNDV